MWKKIVNNTKKWFADAKHFVKKQNRNTIFAVVAIILVVIVAGIFYFKSNPNISALKFWQAGDKKIAQSAVDYINNNGLASSTVSLVSVERTSGLIKIKIKIGTSEFDSYITKDGKLLFPQAIEMTPTENQTGEKAATTSAASCDELAKTDSPVVEAYVVSQCPYGLQMQRAMADAVARVPELANYIKARYIGSVSGDTITSMHGEEEATENLRQICIREEQAGKYWGYVSCQIKAGNSKACESSTGVDSGKLSACVSDKNRGVAYAAKDFELADKYSVSGSPTIMLGEAVLDESGFGGRSSEGVKQIVCCASKTQPGFCSQTLNTAAAASSYSESYAGSDSSNSTANCGS
jgi:hypothetical protein